MYYGALHLKRLGHEVHFACLNTVKHRQDPAKLAEVGPAFTVDIDTTVTMAGALKGLFTQMPYNVARFRSPEFEALLSQLVRDNAYDIVQFEGSYLALYSDAVRQGGTTRLVLRSHNVEAVIWQRLAAGERNPLKKIYLNQLARKIARFERDHLHDFDAIIPIAAQDEAYYRKEGFSGLLETVNAGADTDYFHPQGQADPLRVAYLGALDWMPNVEGLNWMVKEVWPKVKAMVPGASFHIAGKNAPPSLTFPADAGVHLHGRVPDAAAFLAQAAVVVVPLHSGSGMRLKLVEAFAAAKAVVSTAVGAEGIACEHEKNILIADTAQAFAQSLIHLLQHPAEAMRMGAAARQLAESQYSWPALAAKMEGVYRKLL